MSKVYIVGAGSGDAGLLTIKAKDVIEKADVILYDRLVNKEILKFAKKECRFIFVGKEKGNHLVPQEQINALLYENAQNHEIVVRLKGGDPFVFGRGGEEAVFLKEKGIDYEIIPGVSSITAVSSYAGIPLTHRGISAGFRVVTGHEMIGDEKIDWNSFKDDDTLVILMGLTKLEAISKKLIAAGKNKNTPVAVISNGTLEKQRVVVGTLEDIYKKTDTLETPAMIIVGKVVELREKIRWFD